MMEMDVGRWGSWEELLLGGAVLRYGTHDWDMVAAELRARILCPYDFTPEVCKAKFEDLRQRFSGRKAWFEELRKQRMEELRQALEQSQSSIGSLESKLETLKAEKGDTGPVEYDSSRTVSLELIQKCRDGISSRTFTQETSANWSTEEIENKPSTSVSPEQLKHSMVHDFGGFCLGIIRKRRGKRKRKDCSWDVKEASVGESECTGSVEVLTDTQSKEVPSISDNGSTKFDANHDHYHQDYLRKETADDLMRIFSSIMELKSAHVFKNQLEGQKRGKYKKMVRRHIDLETIKTGLANRSITSSMELFRDLLLLINNVLVFFSKSTREYKLATILRDRVNRALQQHNKDRVNLSESHDIVPTEPQGGLTRTGNRNPPGKINRKRSRKPRNPDANPPGRPTATGRKCSGPSTRGGRGNARPQSSSSGRGRKRTRTK